MRHKILIADDSLTIQKVIKITLANEPFDLEVCSSAKDLAASVQSFNPNIVLLDFNLSEDNTGYELCSKIKSLNSDIKVFMLFGTFDTIDEEKLSSSGCDNKIVKPFDGTKFINICRTLADQVSSKDSFQEGDDQEYDFDMSTPSNDTFEDGSESTDLSDAGDEETGWVMDAPEHEDNIPEPIEMPKAASPKKSALDLEVEDWGMSVPGVIGADDEDQLDIPEVINLASVKRPVDVPEEREEDVTNLPDQEDLEYPDIIASDSSDDDLELDLGGPKLTPLSDLNLDDEPASSGTNEIDFDAPKEGTNTEEELRRIEEQIKDEVDSNDIWAFDEVEESVEVQTVAEVEPEVDDIPMVKPHKLADISEDDYPFDEHHKKEKFESDFMKKALADFPDDLDFETGNDSPIAKTVSTSVENLLNDPEFEEKVKNQLRPIVEEYVKQYSKTMIEKVAWEVIPDLAENLIRKEIERISESILNP